MNMGFRNQAMQEGVALIAQFCAVNDLPLPDIRVADRETWPFSVCAYYRSSDLAPATGPYIAICLEKCSGIGEYGPQWSYPGYIADRTPYGVMAHEIGHHCDVMRGPTVSTRSYYSLFSVAVRKESGEKKLTSYAPNDAEWFAEMMRLFITNPDLLCYVRPATYRVLRAHFEPVELRGWREVLKKAPKRTYAAAEQKVVESVAC